MHRQPLGHDARRMSKANRIAQDRRAHRAMVRRLIRHWERTSAADLEAGLAWYARAERAARAIAAGTSYTPRQAAGVIAALSPRLRWAENLDGASTLVEHFTHSDASELPSVLTLGASVAKACRILHGEAPEDALGGPKVRAFYANITGDHSQVTVDVWAARAALGREVGTFGPAEYRRIAKAYVSAAAKVGASPRDFQAAIWVHVRGSAD